MTYIHKQLAQGQWFRMSLIEQMANIGTEVHRAIIWRKKDNQMSLAALYRALDLFDLSLDDPNHRHYPSRLKEIARAREVVCDYFLGDNHYQSSEESLENYFFPFAFAARRNS